eukprot:CAMPEP_0185724064 /NCGR_PEP_ID=MMETSP1171-20130828/667_1 /TAXON_ID=374046 /ORGANISM="Helicotheca tamensis, Strain CCMP826" /LENGTH=103 /DNA_ID=CAMNT_0028391839 /DNA_START=177 /DNA_END=488 /DNA_ORIENTATION=-
MPIVLLSARNATETSAAKATFRVLPKMTKHEVKEHLTKIYNLPVVKVNTQNFMGQRKRVVGKRRVAYYKYADFKKAIVTFGPSLTDVGLGVRVDEMEEEENEE